MKYDFKQIEEKWQNNAKSLYEINKGKFYVLEMLPYPSGKIHMGHIRNYTLGDAYARYMKMNGYEVLHPMGWDAFGLPAENAAKQYGINPAKWTYQNIDEMRKEIKSCGFSYDWTREICTCDENYYKHEQEFFIKFFQNGIIYQKESLINWDPVDNTVLANEQVIDGRGWRSGALVEKKSMKQWFCKITDFAEELLDGLNSLNQWPENIKTMQYNWIGKSEGVIINFQLANSHDIVEVYTTRPDTIFGCTFIGIAYDHKILQNTNNNQQVEDFIKECSMDSLSEATIQTKEKKGIHTGMYVIHPFNKSLIPIYIANFVLSTYGTGAIFGCPGHDERDYEFAKKYNIDIKKVVQHDDNCYTGDGIMINSDFLNGLTNQNAKNVVIDKLYNINAGYRKINYRLRDWSISRQKYWGCPIPIIYCKNCGTIPAKELPVVLPKNANFSSLNNPLASHDEWKYVICYQCGAIAERETDTLDTFFESSWYFAKYCTLKDKGIDIDAVNDWMPVNCYIGGAEHAVMHLLYARFFTKALKKCGYWNIEEPFLQLYTQGMVCNAAYKNMHNQWVKSAKVKSHNGKYYIDNEEVFFIGYEKMSKSKQNGIEPSEYIAKYGADTIRMFVLSDSPPDKDLDWNDNAVEGIYRYLQKLYKMLNLQDKNNSTIQHEDYQLTKLQHKTIVNVTEDYKSFRMNKAIARVRELNNALNDMQKNISQSQIISIITTIVQLLHPIIPHITAEIAEKIHCKLNWPSFDATLLIDDNVVIAIQVNGKLRGTINVMPNTMQNILEKMALNLQTVHNAINDNKIKKVIYVTNKILNFIC